MFLDIRLRLLVMVQFGRGLVRPLAIWSSWFFKSALVSVVSVFVYTILLSLKSSRLYALDHLGRLLHSRTYVLIEVRNRVCLLRLRVFTDSWLV